MATSGSTVVFCNSTVATDSDGTSLGAVSAVRKARSARQRWVRASRDSALINVKNRNSALQLEIRDLSERNLALIATMNAMVSAGAEHAAERFEMATVASETGTIPVDLTDFTNFTVASDGAGNDEEEECPFALFQRSSYTEVPGHWHDVPGQPTGHATDDASSIGNSAPTALLQLLISQQTLWQIAFTLKCQANGMRCQVS